MMKKEIATIFRRFDYEHYHQMIDYYTLKIELDKTNYFYWGARGAAHYELERFDEAISDLSQAIEINPNYVMGYYNRGRSYFGLEDFEQAIKDLEKSKSLDNSLVVYDYYLGLSYAHFDYYDEAIECYSSILKGNAKKEYFCSKTVMMIKGDLNRLTEENEKVNRSIAELLA